MPSTYSTSLRLELIGNGEQAGNWGNTNNINLGTLLEQAIAGVENVAISGTSYTLTTGNGVSDQARNAVIVLTGTLSANCNVIVPSVDKTYTFRNATTGGFSVVIKTAAGSGVTIANGYTQTVYCDATNVVASGAAFNNVSNTLAGNLVGNVFAGAGTVAAPSVSFSGDPDTGISNPDANEIGISTAGAEKVRINSTGVGIGTSVPGSEFDVKGTLRLSGSTSGYVGFSPQPIAGSTTYTLPGADGIPGQILSTDGAGNLSWDGFIQFGTSAVQRTMQNKMREWFSVKDFGAVADGTTNDGPAFQAALNAIITQGGGTLFVPSGRYRITQLLSAACNAQQHISVIGQGRYQSTLDFSGAASLGIEFNSTSMSNNQLPVFEIRDLGLITSRDNAGTALSFNYANSNNLDASVYVADVFIGQNIDRISDQGSGYGYWTTGIYTNNARNGEIRNVHAYGELQKSPNSSRGVWLDGESTAFVCSDSLFLEWTTGIEGTGTTEGIYLNNTDIVYCRYGARHTIASGAEPQFTAVGCSFNCADIGVWLTNSQQSVIADSLFYAASALDTGTWPEWRGVLIEGNNSRFNKVSNCTFTKEIQRTGDTTTGIDFNQGRNYSASGNHFFGFSDNNLTFGIITRAGVTDVKIGDDNIFEFVSNQFANSGTRSIRQPLVQSGTATVATGATITFPQAFNTTPNVMAIHDGTNTALNVTVSAITTSQFVVNHNGGGSAVIQWIAVGF